MKIEFSKHHSSNAFYFVKVNDVAIGWMHIDFGGEKHGFASYPINQWTKMTAKDQQIVRTAAWDHGALLLLTKRLTA